MPRIGTLAALLLVLALLTLPAGAQARTFTGAITVTSVSTPADAFAYVTVQARVSVTETCDPAVDRTCIYVLSAYSVAGGDPCAQSVRALRWAQLSFGGSIADQAVPGWLESPRTAAGRRTVCLYEGVGAGATLIAQTSFTVPPPPGVVVEPAPAPAPPPVTIVDFVCGDFTYQEDAQAELLPGDPYGLDPDGNGLACDTLPHRPVAAAAAPAPAPAAAPAPAPAGETAAGAAPLKAKEAAAIARDALASRFKSAWTHGERRHVACRAGEDAAERDCVARWVRGAFRYRAVVNVQREGDGYRYKVASRTRVRR